jgi:hypothetical protein
LIVAGLICRQKESEGERREREREREKGRERGSTEEFAAVCFISIHCYLLQGSPVFVLIMAGLY